MIKDLVIVGIPKDEEALTEVLEVIKDRTWTKEAKEAWLHPSAAYIWYDKKYEQYVMGGKLPNMDNVNIRTYEEIIK